MINIPEILLVEDNPGDVRLTQEAFKEGAINSTLHTVPDGVQAIAFLYQQEPYHNAPRPDIILLDLNLPRKNGLEVLQEIKQDSNLRQIPVVILTTSRAEEDIKNSYDRHANCYISKPVDLDQFFDVVRSVENFWLSTAKLPSHV